MRYISLDMAKAGMKLAYTIFDTNNRVLLGSDTILKDEHLQRLEERGFAGIYIDDELSKDILIEETIPAEVKNLGIKALKTRDIDAAVRVSAETADRLMSDQNLSLDLVDLRSFDDYTYRHSVNVCVLATVVGISLDMNVKQLLHLSASALLHDIGKLEIAPEILNKKSRLTPEEYAIMKNHPEIAYNLLRKRSAVAGEICQAVLYHHENEDGSGYPNGLRGNSIPLLSKIIHAVDVYDALTSRRPYKKPYAISDAIEYLMGGCGTMFNQKVVQMFLKSVPVYPRGTMVKLSDGRMALVVQNSENPMRPKIRFEDGTDADLYHDKAYRNVTIAPTTEVELDFSERFPVPAVPQPFEADKRQTILIVDDMVVILRSMQAILEKEYHVVLAKSGMQALRYLDDNPLPDLIIMDIDMPKMNGIEAAERIHAELGEKIPIVFLTGLSDKKTVMQCRMTHAKDYIIKPCKPFHVLERIHMVLGESERMSCS